MEAATAPPTRLRLWEIANELDAIGELIAEAGGELTPTLEEALDSIEGAFDEKVERVGLFIRECEANALAAKIEEERLAAIRRGFENKSKGLKRYLKAQLERVGRDKVKTPRVSVRIQRNGRPSIRWVSEYEPPEEFRVVSVRADTQKAYEAWKAEKLLPNGFVVEHSSHIRVS